MSPAYTGPIRWDLFQHNAKSREFGDGPVIFFLKVGSVIVLF